MRIAEMSSCHALPRPVSVATGATTNFGNLNAAKRWPIAANSGQGKTNTTHMNETANQRKETPLWTH